jgi:hypothetical protein
VIEGAKSSLHIESITFAYKELSAVNMFDMDFENSTVLADDVERYCG